MRVNMTKLQQLRQEQGFSPKHLARRAGVTHDTVMKMERGAREPHPSTVAKVAKALGVSLATLGDRPDEDISTDPPVAGDAAPVTRDPTPPASPQDELTTARRSFPPRLAGTRKRVSASTGTYGEGVVNQALPPLPSQARW